MSSVPIREFVVRAEHVITFNDSVELRIIKDWNTGVRGEGSTDRVLLSRRQGLNDDGFVEYNMLE